MIQMKIHQDILHRAHVTLASQHLHMYIESREVIRVIRHLRTQGRVSTLGIYLRRDLTWRLSVAVTWAYACHITNMAQRRSHKLRESGEYIRDATVKGDRRVRPT